MHEFIEFIISHGAYAPWTIFGIILLAGFNIPISIDIVIVLSAFLAATHLPEHAFSFYLSILFGCYFSAMIAYWIGRTLGTKLFKISWFSKLIPPERFKKVSHFYEKYGLITLIVGRFIPFGIRNCIFMTTGMSKVNFGKFILRDAIACLLWSSLCFYAFYTLGLNYQVLMAHVKVINLWIFIVFSVTVITLFCYKKYKKKKRGLT